MAVLLFSCSSDDDGGGTVDNNDYFPVTANAMWHYDYEQTNQVTNSGNTIVDINGSTVFDGETYQILDNTTYLVGTMNQVFFKKDLDREVSIRPMIEILGEYMDFGELELLQNSMQPNTVVDEASNSFVGETMPIPDDGSGITGTVTPTTEIFIRNRHINRTNNMLVNGVDYQAITQQKLEYDIKVTLQINATAELAGQTINIDREHSFVEQQEFGALNIYFANEVGIIKTNYEYSFDDLNLNTEINLGGLVIDILDIAPEVANFNNALHVVGSAELNEYSL